LRYGLKQIQTDAPAPAFVHAHATGTAHEWRLRDGNTVIEVWDLAYNPVGSTPATGTASPLVQRVLKGGAE